MANNTSKTNGTKKAKITLWSGAMATVLASCTGLILGLANKCAPEELTANLTHQATQKLVEQLSRDIIAERHQREADLTQIRNHHDYSTQQLKDFVATYLAGMSQALLMVRGQRLNNHAARQQSQGNKELLEKLMDKNAAISTLSSPQRMGPPAPPKPAPPVRKLPSIDKLKRNQLQQKAN